MLTDYFFFAESKALTTSTAVFDLTARIDVDDFSIFLSTCDACSLEMTQVVGMYKEDDGCNLVGSLDHLGKLWSYIGYLHGYNRERESSTSFGIK